VNCPGRAQVHLASIDVVPDTEVDPKQVDEPVLTEELQLCP